MSPRKFPINPKDIVADIPDILADRLRTVGGGPFNDPSLTDRLLIRSMLECGLTIEQVVATFASSPRGKDAWRRHMNFDAYLRRTMGEAIDKMKAAGWTRDGSRARAT